MTVQDVYLLALHEPYESREHPAPINATIVHAATLRHPQVPQPDGGRMYRCLTEAPGRSPGSLVPLSTLTHELDGGLLWDQVGDWEQVVDAVVDLARAGGCDALPLGMPQAMAVVLANGPSTNVRLRHPDGTTTILGAADRQRHLDDLAGHVRQFVEQAPFWPGNDLTTPPGQPTSMPYQPLDPLSSPPRSPSPSTSGDQGAAVREQPVEGWPSRWFRKLINPGH